MQREPIAEIFENRFDESPEWIIKSPGRINLIGEHIDYLEGFVLPAAIDRYLTLAVRANASGRVNIWTSERDSDSTVSFELNQLEPFSGDRYWLNYIGGVVEMYRREGIVTTGFDVAIISNLPSGAGLSSSAALETGTALAVESVTGNSIDPLQRAKLCLKAEQEFAGVPCGIMDQIAVGLGRKNQALMLDCRDVSVRSVSIPKGVAIVVSDTRVTHALGDGEYRKRRESCDQALEILAQSTWRNVTFDHLKASQSDLGPLLYRRSHHVVTEMKRVSQMSDALVAGELGQVAELMREGHNSLRDDFEVSCPELDFLVDAAYEFGLERGLVGSRMTGGGFGGSTVSLVSADAAHALKDHLEQSFVARYNSEPNCFITKISDGASVESTN